MKKPEHMLCGVNIGDYEFIPDTILDVVKKYKFGKENGNLFRFLSIRVDKERPTSEHLYRWAEYFRDNGVYFCLANNYSRYQDIPLTLTKEETVKIAEIAGEYFLGDEIGEFGGFYATRAKGYLRRHHCENPVQGSQTCEEGVETYKKQMGKLIKKMKENVA
jgi:cytochrome oxidase Cu insertion factor (SCO1/SenC/PrrC family)